jgi:hypothetical protein
MEETYKTHEVGEKAYKNLHGKPEAVDGNIILK